MTSRINTDQWRDKTQEPVIIWVPISAYASEPVAMDDSHDADLYDEFTRAWFAVGQYQTREEVNNNASWYDLTPEQIEELYSRGDGSEEAAGLPREYYAQGCNEDGSDPLIYVSWETEHNTHRESLKEAARDLDPEDVADIYRAILAEREKYDIY